MYIIFFFFFKQKTAYEMRISDWSSDVCSSDLKRFCGFFGDIGRRARPAEARNEPSGTPEGMMYVSNLRVEGKQIGSLPDGEMQFHKIGRALCRERVCQYV